MKFINIRRIFETFHENKSSQRDKLTYEENLLLKRKNVRGCPLTFKKILNTDLDSYFYDEEHCQRPRNNQTLVKKVFQRKPIENLGFLKAISFKISINTFSK